MATKIKIKFSEDEYNAISDAIEHIANTCIVHDLYTLNLKERLEVMSTRLLSKKFKHQRSYQFSFSIVDTIELITRFATVGAYEKAICELIFEKQINPQFQSAVQMRMNFNNN